jgi:hypothetical protein
MPRNRLLSGALAILSGVALAGVLVAFALARLAAHPSVPGTQPRADFVTLVPVGIGSEFSDGGAPGVSRSTFPAVDDVDRRSG